MTRSMTYDEIAGALGITRDSARQLVHRKHWMRRKGNDGKARIDVPEEVLEVAPPPHDTGADPPHEAGSDMPHAPPQELSAIQALTRVIEDLREEIVELRARALEREALTAQVAALQGILDETRADRDRSRAQLDHVEGELAGLRAKVSESDVLAGQVESLKTALEEARQERDRWAVQAHALAHPAVPHVPPVVERRGLFGWFRRMT